MFTSLKGEYGGYWPGQQVLPASCTYQIMFHWGKTALNFRFQLPNTLFSPHCNRTEKGSVKRKIYVYDNQHYLDVWWVNICSSKKNKKLVQ